MKLHEVYSPPSMDACYFYLQVHILKGNALVGLVKKLNRKS